ncbi:MAG: (d)CMP kinase [candidate division WOR-3 bacterium]|nr:(d)CMP kinase [candidate division WOR-3 bacterium]MCX7836622.1 (d)CMP kinase [candidate division WOR-3 bacterium]MDW8113330.1 (d)CMP kinase [candidate division WOR-3 bacterium]
MKKNFIVAIDGYAGSGKSTIAKEVAKRLNFFYLDTGAMYRAITYKIIKERINYQNEEELKRLLKNIKINFKEEKGKIRVYLDSEDVTEKIREPEVEKLVSPISAIKIVREKLVKLQRNIARQKNIIAEGRDITSVVFPKADVKIFVDCQLKERAKRRFKEAKEKGYKIKFREVLKNLIIRDKIDQGRKYSPLRKTADSIYLDTTNLTIEEEVDLVKSLIEYLKGKR